MIGKDREPSKDDILKEMEKDTDAGAIAEAEKEKKEKAREGTPR